MGKIHPIWYSSLALLVLIAGFALAMWRGWFPGGAIYLEVEVQAPQERGEKIILPLKLILRNPSGRVRPLRPQNVCEIFRWFILDGQSAFVQAFEKDAACVAARIDRALSPWEDSEEMVRIELDRARFKPKNRYFLILSFWGLEAHASFTF